MCISKDIFEMSGFSKTMVTITPEMSLTVPSQIAKNWEAEAQQTNETQTFAIFPYFPLSSVCKKKFNIASFCYSWLLCTFVLLEKYHPAGMYAGP